MSIIDLIGLLAAFLTTICYVPQALQIIFKRETAGISLPAYVILALGITCWLVYGLFLHNTPLILANGITLILVISILALKIRLG